MGFGTISGFLVMVVLMEVSEGYKFFVGGKDGWVSNPSENFDHWAQRNRFQVNDTLYFKYEQGSESVLVVNKDDYYSCNTNNPITSLTNGDSVFLLDRSGPFYFIAGNAAKCQKGQRLHLIVLAVRPTKHHHSPSPSPVPSPSRADSPAPAPEQRVDPSAWDDAPVPAPANHKSAAPMTGFSVSGMLLLVVISLVGNVV